MKPTAFMQNSLFWGSMIARGRLFGAAGARNVATVAARVLAEGAGENGEDDGHEGATYFLTGPEAITMDEAAARSSRVLGRTVRYVNVPRVALRLGMGYSRHTRI